MSGPRHVREPAAEDSGPLPARPDALSGEPAPPAAPAYHGPNVLARHSPASNRKQWRRPRPPSGMGPVLSWYRLSHRGWLARFLLALVLLIGGASTLSLVRGEGLALLAAWPVWPVVLLGALLMSPLPAKVSVGADWLQRGRHSVRLYELTAIDAGYDPTWLRLADGHTSLRFTLDELQRERAAWNLIYNGVRHSLAAGATITPAAARLLEVPAPAESPVSDDAR